MLTGDSPACHFQLGPAAILEVYFSAKKVDAATFRESLQKFTDGARGSYFQQAAVPDFIFFK
jgi:hypothetical protein